MQAVALEKNLLEKNLENYLKKITTWKKSLWMFLVSAFRLELWARAHLSLKPESSSITARLFDLAFVFPWVVENPEEKKAQHWQRILARL